MLQVESVQVGMGTYQYSEEHSTDEYGHRLQACKVPQTQKGYSGSHGESMRKSACGGEQLPHYEQEQAKSSQSDGECRLPVGPLVTATGKAQTHEQRHKGRD